MCYSFSCIVFPVQLLTFFHFFFKRRANRDFSPCPWISTLNILMCSLVYVKPHSLPFVWTFTGLNQDEQLNSVNYRLILIDCSSLRAPRDLKCYHTDSYVYVYLHLLWEVILSCGWKQRWCSSPAAAVAPVASFYLSICFIYIFSRV